MQTLHSVCHIAEVLLSLQQAGNVKYTGWILQVPCSTSEQIISTLRSQARTMEEELVEWNKTVIKARHKFYDLSYFTTVQLLTLRRELGALNDSSHAGDIPPNVLVLLQSISSLVVSENVRQVVQEVTANPSSALASPLLEQSTAEDECDSTKTPPGGSPVTFEVGNNQPHLREEDLTDEQKDIMSYVVLRLSCSKLLVLKAFEECQYEEMNRYEYMHWCNKHIEEFEFEDEHEQSNSDEDLAPKASDEAESGPTGFCYLLGN